MGKGEDRISYLPDSILQIILTMMPLKSAVRTDVLCKKWRDLWKHSLFTATELEFGEDFASTLSAREFVKTVNRYLLLNNTERLERFAVFFCPFDMFLSDIERWISYVVGKRVRHLDINLSQGFRELTYGEFIEERIPFELPSSLFDCDSLIELSLSRCNFKYPLNLSNFGGLQSLSVSHSNIDEEMLQEILAKCSLLESLCLRNCGGLELISIMNPDLKLKKLTIGDCWAINLLEINAPKLQSFHRYGKLSGENNFLDVSSLEDASIYSIGRNDVGYIDILASISHVQILTLCTATLVHLNQIEEYNPDDFPVEMQDLQELQLLMMDSMTNEDLTCFFTFFSLCSFPFIEKLFIQLPKHIDDPNEQKHEVTVMLNPESLDTTTLNHLKLIKVTNFKGSINEMRLVSFLLQKATVLETLVLVLPPVLERNTCKERMVLRILRGQVCLLQRESSNVQITVHEFGEDDGLNPKHVEIYNDYSCLPVVHCMAAGSLLLSEKQ